MEEIKPKQGHHVMRMCRGRYPPQALRSWGAPLPAPQFCCWTVPIACPRALCLRHPSPWGGREPEILLGCV